jgi:hypothetical protein
MKFTQNVINICKKKNKNIFFFNFSKKKKKIKEKELNGSLTHLDWSCDS